MDSRSSNSITIKEFPIAFWVLGAVFAVGGAYVIVGSPEALIFGALGIVLGFVFLALAPITTITADRLAGQLSLHYRSLLRGTSKQIPLSQITAVEIDRSTSRSRGRRSTTYRIEFVTANGERTPLHSYYSSGYREKEQKAQRLCEFIGLASPERPVSPLQALFQPAQQGVSRQEGVTDGVSWQIETIAAGGSPVNRWRSPNFTFPGGFLCLMQNPQGTNVFSTSGGVMGSVAQFLYRQVLGLLGFGPEDTPGLDSAHPLDPPEPRIHPQFATLTSDAFQARQILNAWTAIPLAQWAERRPFRQASNQAQAGQLVVLYSPQGVTVSLMGTLSTELTDEMIRLGVELVRAQGGSQ